MKTWQWIEVDDVICDSVYPRNVGKWLIDTIDITF